MKIVRRWLATMECRLLCSAGLGAGWSSLGPCWRLKILAWLVVIHAVTRRSCAGHLSIGASRGFHYGTREYQRATLPVSCTVFLFFLLLRLYSTSAEGLQDTRSYSLLKMLSLGQYVWKVVDRKKIHDSQPSDLCSNAYRSLPGNQDIFSLLFSCIYHGIIIMNSLYHD